MPRRERERVRQATHRTHGRAIPRPHRLRRADRRHGLPQRPSPQGHPAPPLQRRCRPRPRHLHGGGIVCHQAVRLHRPPRPGAHPTRLARPRPGRGAHAPRRVVGGSLTPHHLQPEGGARLSVEQRPTPEPDAPGLPRDVPLHVRCHLWHVAPGMDPLAVHGAPPGCARGGGAHRSWAWIRRAMVDASMALTSRCSRPRRPGTRGRWARHPSQARSNRASRANVPRSSARATRCQPQRRWTTQGKTARARLPLVWTNRPVILTRRTTPRQKAVPEGHGCIRLCTTAAARDTGSVLGSEGTGYRVFIIDPASQIRAQHATQIGKTQVRATVYETSRLAVMKRGFAPTNENEAAYWRHFLPVLSPYLHSRLLVGDP